MPETVGVRELRQNLSRYLERVKRGEGLEVTERGRVVAKLVPSEEVAGPYAELAEKFDATVPRDRLEDIVARLKLEPTPAGATDTYLAETRAERER